MILTVLLLIGLNFNAMLGTFGSGAVAVAVVFVSLTLAIGYVLGGPAPRTRSVLGLGTGQRNIAAALVIATQNFTDPGVVVMLLVSTLAGLIPLLFAARCFARRCSSSTTGTGDSESGPVSVQAGVTTEEVKP
jgi:BASS family bile acid:Na+ symporter